MIDNNVDRMSVNILPFSLDRIVRRLEDQSVDKSLQHLFFNRINQDQLVTVCSLRTNQPGFFYQYFSLISGNEVSLTLISTMGHWNKTRLIREH